MWLMCAISCHCEFIFCLLFFAISIFIVDFRVRQNLDKNLTLVDPDPGKAYTRAKKAKCNFCTVDTQLTNPDNQQPEDPVTDMEEDWSSDTSVLPEQFSYLNIVEHAKKTGRDAKSYVEKPLEKDTSFSMKITVMMSVVGLTTMKYM